MRTVTMYVERGYSTAVNHKLINKLLKEYKKAVHIFYCSSKIELCIPISESMDERISMNMVGTKLSVTYVPKSMRSSYQLQYINVPTLPRNYKGVV